MPKLYQDYFEGKLLRFLEHDGHVYVDTNDLSAFFEEQTMH